MCRMRICTSLRKLPAPALLMLVAMLNASGQVDHGPSGAVEPGNATQGRLQTVWISALDSRDRPIPNLRKEDLRLYEDATERKIETLAANDAERLTVGLLVDASMKSRLPFFRPRLTGSSRLLDPILKGGGSLIVAAFGDRLSAGLPTSDPGQLQEYIQKAARVWMDRKTALFDGIEELCQGKLQEGRKALVVVSDGDDTASKLLLADAVRAVKLTRTQVFFVLTVPESIEMFIHSQLWMMDAQDASLQLAFATGGKAYRVHVEAEVDRAFEEIAGRLTSEYAVKFYSSGSARSHTIRVQSVRRGIRIVSQQDYPARQD